MVKKQFGFTLIESLVVLSIFLILSSVTAFSLKPQHSVLEEKAFLTQLQADLLFAQQYALSHQHDVTVNIQPKQHKYFLIVRTELPPIIERNYSSNFTLTEGSLPLNFKFLRNGNVNKFGSFYIHSTRKLYQLTVLIGQGRFYVTEQ